MSYLRYLCLFVGGLVSYLRYLCLFVGGLMSYLRYLCLFVGGLMSYLRCLCLFVGGLMSYRSYNKYRNINLFSIDYAFRPRLRSRLTLRRLTLRRKPWVFGEGGFHPLYRYSCQHAHFRYLQPTSQLTFAGLRNAPLPPPLIN